MSEPCLNDDECHQPARDGQPETLLEHWTGRTLYCQACLDALGDTLDLEII